MANNSAKFREQLAAHRKQMVERVELGKEAVAYKLLELSVPLVPIETMALAASGHVRREGDGMQSCWIVGYGTPGFKWTGVDVNGNVVTREPANYTVYVHEDLSAAHDAGKQAKFLEQPLLEERDILRAAFNEEVVSR